MKQSAEAIAFFKNMPKKENKPNPYYSFDNERGICYNRLDGKLFDVALETATLTIVREYCRRVWEAFGTESQVLLVSTENGFASDADKLRNISLPEIGRDKEFHFAGVPVAIFVLPQVNTPVNSSVSEKFWQQYIVSNNIIPVARIHSHHILDAYQSMTDYSTLNSGSLEMVLGHINDDLMHVAYWLDEKGKDTKEYVFVADQVGENDYVNGRISSGKPLK